MRVYAVSNYLIQGFCAGVLKRAMIKAAEAGLDLRFTVHDELVASCENGRQKEVGRVLAACMCEVGGFKFPVDLAVAETNWADKAPLKLEDN